jgi:hypothetical protein
MIKALEEFDKMAAVGVLARAALSLGYCDGPQLGAVEREEDIQTRVVEEVRSRLGISKDDNSRDALDRMADCLDAESDQLLAAPDTEAALSRLAERGDLPSDMYEIGIVPDIPAALGKRFALEKDVIATTIRDPTTEQHFGPARGLHEPAMISLFLRNFRTKWPLRDFFMLVAAQRDGFHLQIHQAWRIYPSRIDVSGLATPVDWLKRFSESYGAKVEVEGTKANFFLFLEGKIPPEVKWELGSNRKVVVSRFALIDPITKTEQAALIVGIDIYKYLATLDELGVRREDFLDSFVPARQPRD